MTDPLLLTAYDVLPSPARVDPTFRTPLRVALVQECWRDDPDAVALSYPSLGQSSGVSACRGRDLGKRSGTAGYADELAVSIPPGLGRQKSRDRRR